MKPVFAVVDIDVHANKDELFREALLHRLEEYEGPAVKPLWLNWLRVRADLILACMVHDLTCFDDFLMDVVRPLPGVRSTAVFLCFDGVIHSDIVDAIPLQDSVWSRRASAFVEVHVEPGKDRQVFEALSALPEHNQVETLYVMKLMHCHACDMVMLIFGERTAALSGYVNSWVRTIPGVEDTRVMSTLDWKLLARTEELISLAKNYPQKQHSNESA